MNTTHPQAKLTLKRVAFYFIRHGETDWNVQKKIMGQLDIPLNNRGKEQAHRYADIIKNLIFQQLFVVP